jgi:hypothetical protein
MGNRASFLRINEEGKKHFVVFGNDTGASAKGSKFPSLSSSGD